MSETSAATEEGWGWPYNAAKAHYFVDREALCRRWMYAGDLSDPEDPGDGSDCAKCRRELLRRRQRAHQ